MVDTGKDGVTMQRVFPCCLPDAVNDFALSLFRSFALPHFL
jgi:hypothetical protein